MDSEILVAVLSMCGTAIGALGGVMASARLTNFRLEKLEKKVDEHNSFGSRLPVIEQKIDAIEERVDKLEQAL